MSHASLSNQIAYVLNAMFWDANEIRDYKSVHKVISVKRDLRPAGDPTQPLPAILSYRTRTCYFQLTKAFFQRAKALTGKKLLVDLLDPGVVRLTLDTHYRDVMPSTQRTVLTAIGKIHQGCMQVGWTEAPSPVTKELRAHVKAFRDDGDIRQARYGYIPEDAESIVGYLKENNSTFTLPAEIALRCGLRISEIAGLQGKQVDLKKMVLHVTGKGGRKRDVELPKDLAERMNPSKQYLFNPNRAWKKCFNKAVREAARAKGINVSGVHRLRANYAQKLHTDMIFDGKSDQEARKEVSRRLGHNRIQVTYNYVPKE